MIADPRRFEIFEEKRRSHMSAYARDLTEAALEDELLQSEEPILVDFWAPWCGPCRAMSPAVEAAAQKLVGEAKVYKVNVDENPSVSSRFGVLGIPTLILFKDGRETNRLVGLSSKEQIEALVTS
jgi:thioredoxin 1